MSSPSQHPHQHPPYYSSDTLAALLNLENDLQNAELLAVPASRDYSGLPNVYDDLDFSNDLPPDFVYDLTLDFDLDEKAEESTHQRHFSLDRPLLTPFFLLQNARMDFNHSRNISLDDSAYKRSHQHLSSIVSNLADPPSGTFAHSYSSTTLQLLSDLVPQLLLLVSNPLLLDSPHSTLQTATPGRRHKSTSVSSHTNLYTTPLRGGSHVSPLTHSKIGKTPHLALGKSHRRNRLKASLEPSSAHLLATVANMKGNNGAGYVSQTPSGNLSTSHYNISLNEENPFHNEFVSPRFGGNVSDHDATPLTTPAGKTGNHMSSQYFTPISHNQSFGGSLLENLSLAMGLALMIPSNLSLNDLSMTSSLNLAHPGMATLRRNDTLDSIKIEDQEDDACKQLRKAKSFTSFGDQNSRMTRIVNSRSGRSSNDLSNVFADSTPDLSADGSPPKYTRDQHPRDAFKKSASIDLLLPELVATDRMGDKNLKSYPASIDLASITQSSGTSHASPLPPVSTGRLMPPIGNQPSLANMPTASRSNSYVGNPRQNLLNAAAKKLSKVPTGYPTASQIQKTSTTEDIAKFAESILQSDTKRPIYVQLEQKDVYDPKKKHKCPLCLARFQRPEHVKRHLKSHSTDKPFQCDEPDCGRRFNRKDNLKAHLKKIHGKVV